MRRRKLGLKAWDDATRDGLWERLHGLMEAAKPDYTVFWRQLAAWELGTAYASRASQTPSFEGQLNCEGHARIRKPVTRRCG